MAENCLKRKLSPQSVSAKRLRDSCGENTSQNSTYLNAHAGTIKKISLINFMCHEALELDLCQGVTFITGRNGSGKSAILTALVIGLGGKASDTNRGYSLKEFIKTNETYTTIKIVINNFGYNAFRPDLYGDQIIVQRTININSNNQYKIMSSSGDVISSKHDDLQRILLSLNLQVDNPVAILTQDTARNFLHNTKPTDKYLFFLKATRLEHIESIYRGVHHSIIKSRESQAFHMKTLEDLKVKKSELQKKLKALLSMEQTKDRLEAVQNELSWAHVVSQEKDLDEKKTVFQEQENVLEEVKADISKLKGDVESINEKKKLLEKKSQEIMENNNSTNARSSEFKKAAEILNKKYKDKADEVQSKKEDIAKLKRNYDTLQEKISNMQSALNKDGPRNKQELENAVSDLTQEATEVASRIKMNQQYLHQLEVAHSSDSDSVRSLEEELRNMNAKIAKNKSRINSLDGRDESLLKLFGDYVITLNNAIQQAHKKGMFSEMPRGPLGAYIKVKDRSWAPAVESIIGGEILRSYYVNSHQDRKALYKLMEKIIGKNQPFPSVTASKFMTEVYNYSPNAVYCPGYSSVLDMLEVSDYLVVNCLIDLLGIESTLLVESAKDAREMMKCEENVPKNCKKAVTKSGDTLYPDPNYRCYSGDDRTEAKFLQVSVNEVKRRLNAEILDCTKWANNTMSQKKEVARRVEQHKKAIEGVKETLKQLSSKKMSIAKKIRELEQTEVNDVDQIEFWIGERDSISKELDDAEKDIIKLNEEHENLKQTYMEFLNKYDETKSSVKVAVRELDAIVKKSNQLDDKLSSIHLNLKNCVKKEAECEKALARCKGAVEKQQKLVEKITEDALSLTSKRIDTERSVTEIKEEIKELKETIERVERSEGNPKEISERYMVVKAKCDEMATKINLLDDALAKLRKMIKHRREVYSRCLQLLVTRVKMVFQSLIDRRRFQGGIEVDHKEHTLDIKVTLRNPSPKTQVKTGAKRGADSGSDPKSLSGGERSFSTVAFILSLWDAVELPFYALDEFDVFMDNANREWTLNLLLDHSREKKDFQFVFLTPQALNSADLNDTIVYDLKAHEAQRRAIRT